ncbi:hypothetical protein CTAYLR_009020 [Chrysophaeum taylorii]|uniref:glycerol kinase n=1 Tax=Chrysophaeum taylorii TaxID=2483200 RepID=A0AAD7XIT8_9STRA|nr:hypothetical protein CTAYLR_009020 [Chrysophaeum taylorii]
MMLLRLVVGGALQAAALSRRQRYVVGIDVGTESLRASLVDAEDGSVVATSSESHETKYPAAGLVEQDPADWWEGLGAAMRRIVAGIDASLVEAVCFACTSCTVIACDGRGEPLRPAIMWCDARAVREAEDMMRLGGGDPALRVNCGGRGPVSAEWMLCKALWIKRYEPRVWEAAERVCEAQDWVNFKCTGRWVAGGCNVATRWHCDGVAAVEKIEDGVFGGRPRSLLHAVDLEDLGPKWPPACVAMGAPVGRLTPEARAHLGGLSAECVVVQGGADAFVALVAAAPEGGGVVVTGSSHLHLASQDLRHSSESSSRGCWGPYRGAPLAHQMMAEGGQSSTGSMLRWAQRLFGAASLAELDAEANEVPVGAEGACALETFQGARTPVTDPRARGAVVGLSLAHARGHVWRALLEAICLGTRASLSALRDVISMPRAVRFCGGATKSPLFLRMHADAANVSIAYDDDNANLVLAGAAILASASATNASISETAQLSRRSPRMIAPDPDAAARYAEVYERYARLAPALADLEPKRGVTISASVLAADAGALRDDAAAAHDAGAWLHLDVCDGSSVSCGALSSLGPASVRALRRALPDAVIDVHLAASDPSAHVASLATAGASRITFQREALASEKAAHMLARHIRSFGCDAGVCISPDTPIADVEPLVSSDLVDLVDLLAVDPGRGGQTFRPHVLDKIRALRARFPALRIMVDGGINLHTGQAAYRAGADILAAGSYVFPATPDVELPTLRRTRIAAAVAALRAAVTA